MENILVLALDSELYDRYLLHSLIPTTAIMSPLGKDEHFESVWMIRLGLWRVLNWLGFDAAMYQEPIVMVLIGNYIHCVIVIKGSLYS